MYQIQGGSCSSPPDSFVFLLYVSILKISRQNRSSVSYLHEEVFFFSFFSVDPQMVLVSKVEISTPQKISRYVLPNKRIFELIEKNSSRGTYKIHCVHPYHRK